MYEPIKKLGQNFLKDKLIIRKMVGALGIKPEDTVIEIGPGLGAITEVLLSDVNPQTTIYAVEIDNRFINKLRDMFSKYPNLRVIEANILDWLPNFDSQGKPFKIIGSLPYYITSPVIHEIIKMKKQPEIAVLIVQKEVAEKIKAKAPDSSYLSVFTQTFFDIEYLGLVEKSRFTPLPEVDGEIIRLIRKSAGEKDIRKYEGFLHKAFAHPRKMLNKIFSKEELAETGINGKKRAQDYSAEEWLRFFKKIP